MHRKSNARSGLILSACLVLAGCAGVSPTTHFHTLRVVDSACAPGGASLPAGTRIGIGPVSLADPLNRSQMITRDDRGQIRFADFQRWSGVLADNIGQVLADCLARRLATPDVFAYPWVSGLRPDYQVRLNFERFDGEPGGTVALKVDWLVIGAGGTPIADVTRTQLTGTVEGRSYADYVEGLERLLGDLASLIASGLVEKKAENGL